MKRNQCLHIAGTRTRSYGTAGKVTPAGWLPASPVQVQPRKRIGGSATGRHLRIAYGSSTMCSSCLSHLDISKCMSQQNDDGRLLRGTVVARKRREVKQGDKTRFCISIFVRWSEGVLPADRWSDKALPDDPPSVGQKVERPVSVGAYLTHGVAMARLTWGAANAGGDF